MGLAKSTGRQTVAVNAKVLMFQGTGSDVGKSTIVAGLCRLATRRGLRVAPFKPQNMSNNAASCTTGGEIGRAQALQARAAGLELDTDFNPVLLKPQSDRAAQVVVQGKVRHTVSAGDYMNSLRADLQSAVLESFTRLANSYDLILVEGAGSPAEINLRNHDIANMGFARAVNAPVCLIGDIDRGGVIAAIAGTQQVIDQDDARLIKSFIINRFRGDPDLFTDGMRAIESITGWPCRGVVPWLDSALQLPQEDAVVLEKDYDSRPKTEQPKLRMRIAVPMLSRIANFDDMDPLKAEPNVALEFIAPGKNIPPDVDAIIIPGTKSTIADLKFLRQQGWHHDIYAAARNGTKILGLCGGYQILGKQINDPERVEGDIASTDGLGLLDIQTSMQAEKRTQETAAICCRSNSKIQGYEIHIGHSTGADTSRPFMEMTRSDSAARGSTFDGAISPDGQIEGTYLHGLFNNDAFRAWWLESLKSGTSTDFNFNKHIENQIDRLADGLDAALDINALLNDATNINP